MHRLSRLLEEVIDLVSIELYGVSGVVEGERLLVTALREGAVHVYTYDGVGLRRLTRTPVSGVARPPYGSRRVVVYRDVARGRELHKLYWLDTVEGVEEEVHEAQKPARVLGVAHGDGGLVVYSAATMEGLGVYAVRGGEHWKVADAPAIVFPTTVRGGLVAGLAFTGDPRGLTKPFTLDLGSGELRVHEPPVEGAVEAIEVDPGGRVLYSVAAEGGARLYRLDPSTGESVEEPMEGDLAGYRPAGVRYIHYTPTGRLVVAAKREWRAALFLDGRRVPAPEGVVGQAFEWRGGLAFTHTSLEDPPRVLHHPYGGGWRVLLEGRRPWWLGEALGGRRLEWVPSAGGERVPVVVLESGRAPRPGPTVVLVHGGPFSEDMDAWNIFAAALAAAGFHVVMPNYRGSTGYGPRWMNLILGDPCGGDLEDVASAAEWARGSGLASRLYVMGYSYGGYMTLCALTRKPGLFEAGVAGAAVADWGEMYELSDQAFKMFIEILFAGRRELWGERSPAAHVASLSEPLCIVHPQNDSRTPLKPVLHFMEKALEAGKRFEAHIAPDMGHTVNTVEDVLKILLPAAEFLARIEQAAQEGGQA